MTKKTMMYVFIAIVIVCIGIGSFYAYPKIQDHAAESIAKTALSKQMKEIGNGSENIEFEISKVKKVPYRNREAYEFVFFQPQVQSLTDGSFKRYTTTALVDMEQKRPLSTVTVARPASTNSVSEEALQDKNDRLVVQFEPLQMKAGSSAVQNVDFGALDSSEEKIYVKLDNVGANRDIDFVIKRDATKADANGYVISISPELKTLLLVQNNLKEVSSLNAIDLAKGDKLKMTWNVPGGGPVWMIHFDDVHPKTNVVVESQNFADQGVVIGLVNQKAKDMGIYDTHMWSDIQRDSDKNIWTVYWTPRVAQEIQLGGHGITMFVDMNKQEVSKVWRDK